MIDDYSISGINETCTSHNKVDLHMIDTLAALVNQYFRCCAGKERDSALVAKTFRLEECIPPDPHEGASFDVCLLQRLQSREGSC